MQDQASDRKGYPYTITGLAIDRDDVRAHGRNERLGVESFYKGVEILLPVPAGAHGILTFFAAVLCACSVSGVPSTEHLQAWPESLLMTARG